MGLGGQDNIDGGAGIDEVRYDRDSVRGGKAGVTVDLTTGEAIDGFGEQDTLTNIENVRGTAFSDTIIGNAAGNDLRGFGGSDTLNGDAGIDFLWGEMATIPSMAASARTICAAALVTMSTWSTMPPTSSTRASRLERHRHSPVIDQLQPGQHSTRSGLGREPDAAGSGNINGTGNALNNVITRQQPAPTC